jgi:hypothetical protein
MVTASAVLLTFGSWDWHRFGLNILLGVMLFPWVSFVAALRVFWSNQTKETFALLFATLFIGMACSPFLLTVLFALARTYGITDAYH